MVATSEAPEHIRTVHNPRYLPSTRLDNRGPRRQVGTPPSPAAEDHHLGHGAPPKGGGLAKRSTPVRLSGGLEELPAALSV